MSPSKLLIATTLALFSLDSLAHAQTTIVGFDGGSNGNFTGNFMFESTGGNPDGNAHLFLSTFFPSLRTGGIGEPANADFLGDYSAFGEVTFKMDVKVDSLTDFIGNPNFRPLGIALVDRDIMGPSGPSGVFFELATLSSSGQPNWTELSVTIDDTTATTLPAGWIGFGDEDPSTFAPILPAGATFATVLAGVDEVRITGAVPGFFFNNANYDMRIDNVTVIKGDGVGTTYCTADANSTGVAGEISGNGSTAVATNDLTLTASNLPVNEFGIFIVGTATNSINVPNSGMLCVGGALGRFNQPGQVLQVDASGAFSLGIDLTQMATPTLPVSVMAGETYYFQAWYRDVGLTSNFTNGLQVDFQ